MPTLIIDNRQIEVAPKTMVIEAAAQLGIVIPRFCYHPALGPVGACRVCAVKLIDGPLKGIQMSCMVEAQDGMVVSTTDEEAVDFRRHVIEWLMLNHPHDCPVCDEGGHCLLQDMTVSGGHGIRRYAGRKRTYIDQDLGPLVQHEMNRCIHCYRCARFYQEYCGYRDLGVMRNANRTFFGRFEDGILQSPFAGNLSDICPTGVYTDKPSRFFGRRWDYQRSQSLCINCSLGCHTVASVRYREVKRQEACFSEAVNGYFICDRGRFGFSYATLESRPRQAAANGEAVSYDRALQAAMTKLAKISKDSGPSAMAVAGSARSSLQTQAMVKHLCRTRGWRDSVFFTDPATTAKVNSAVARLEPELTVSLRQVEGADFILCLGADPINEAPMLALTMRQAHRNGARVVVVDPRPVELPFDFDHLAVAPDDMGSLIGSLIKTVVDRQTAASLGEKAAGFFDALEGGNPIDGTAADSVAAAAAELKNSRQPVIVCGSDIVPIQVPGMAADFGLLLRAADKEAGVFYLLPGANAFGAGLIGEDQASLLDVIEAIEDGQVKALVLVESDPFFDFADRSRLARALDALELLIVVDYLDTESVKKAHILIPSTTLYEMDAIFVNQQGRARMVRQAYRGGTPIVQSGGGDHPPRQYGTGIAGAGPRPAWMILADLAGEKSAAEDKALPAPAYQWPAELAGPLSDVNASSGIEDEGLRLDFGVNTELRFGDDISGPQPEGGANLRLILSDLTFGTEALSAHSECLRELEPQPAVALNTRTAQELGLADGDTVAVQTATGGFEANLQVVENMAAGVLVVPRHRKLGWQIFEPDKLSISRDQIKKQIE